MADDNLLVLLLRRRLRAAGAAAAAIPPGRYRVRAGAMAAVIVRAPDAEPVVHPDDASAADATVTGGMRSLLGVFVGRIGLVRAALSGGVTASGKVWRLLGLLRAMRGR